MSAIEYTLYGEPRSYVRHLRHMPRAQREEQARHAEAGTLSRPDGWEMSGRYVMHTTFYVGTARKVDGPNLVKLVEDALTGVLYDDDSLIVRGFWEKHIDRDDPRTEVRVIALGGGE